MSEDQSGITVGLDATNLRAGGGRTHLIELLGSVKPDEQGVARIVVWGARDTLDRIPDRAWIQKCNPPEQEGNVVERTQWQRQKLSNAARTASCDILFVPGGNYLGDFHPVVTMSRNSLPFEGRELVRYGLSPSTLRLAALRFTQAHTFRHADGVIFLTEYAKRSVTRVVRRLHGETEIVPHGINDRFLIEPRPARSIETCSITDPFRLLYVSNIDVYKHQWVVVDAISRLRERTGWPLELHLVGSDQSAAAVRKLNRRIRAADQGGQWVKRHGAVPHETLHAIYARADVGVFASSCENMPNILIEAMAAGLPLASSDRGPMPEILGSAGVYFDPESAESTASTLQELIGSSDSRRAKAQAAFARARAYSWERCATETFQFLHRVRASHDRSARGRGVTG